MYYYEIRDVWTGETLAEGTAAQLVESGKYASAESVNDAYNGWRRRKEKHGESRVEWARSGERNRRKRKKTAPEAQKSSETRLHTSRRCRSWQAKQARAARQAGAAAAAKPKKPDKYITEKLGDLGTVPEHTKRFAQPPVKPPEAKGKDKPSALRWDVYELECLNWERRQQGKRALTYGEWRAGIR